MVEPTRRPSGRTAIDWEEAFAYYASLPAGERSYEAVAKRFGVSVRTVETHGRSSRWKERLREIADKTAAQTADLLVQARVEEVQKIRRLIEASFIGYAERLRGGEMRMTPADLERLNRLSLALVDEINQPPSGAPETDTPEPPQRTPEHTAAVVQALTETGVLEALGLHAAPQSNANDDAGATP